MHDLDRTMFEVNEYSGETQEAQEFQEILGEVLSGEVGGTQEVFESNEAQEMQEILAAELGQETYETYETYETSETQELQELELASELLATSNEAELDRFIGKLIGRAGRAVGSAVGNFASSSTGRALGGVLKSAAKQALPIVGRAAGNWIAPGRGGEWGARVGTATGNLFGLELEGLSQEDREFEVARSFVRFANEAAKKAACARPTASPPQVVKAAVTAAARSHAPGLLQALPRPSGGPAVGTTAGTGAAGAGGRGQWVRRGNAVVLLGL
jgi:hypothetical protein